MGLNKQIRIIRSSMNSIKFSRFMINAPTLKPLEDFMKIRNTRYSSKDPKATKGLEQ